MKRSIRGRIFLGLASLLMPAAARAFEADPAVAAALAKPVVSADLTRDETRSFVEARIKKMPEAKTLEEWTAAADAMREKALDEVVFKGAARAWRDADGRVEFLGELAGGPGYRIKKLRYEALPGFWIPALLYEPLELGGKRVPVVLNVNGHGSLGKATAFKQERCINLAKRGMLALNIEWVGMGQLETPDNAHWMINHIDLCGASGVGTHYRIMSRAIDVLLAHENADPKRVALTGLSGGGWQTIFQSAFDRRITLSVPVAGYSSFFTRARFPSDLGDSEQTPVDLGLVTDYAPMTAMLADRAAMLIFNAKDNCCFASDHALPPLVDAARPIFELHGRANRLMTHVNHDPGTHNYLVDNREALYRAIAAVFYPDDPKFPTRDIDSSAEVKSAAELQVPLPDDNLSLHAIARSMSRDLPRPVKPRADRLLTLLRADRLEVDPEAAGEESLDKRRIRRWKLRMGREWTVPAVEFVPSGEPKGVALLVADGGKRSVASAVERHLAAGRRVLAIDIYNTGESTFPSHAYLWSLFVGTVGERPLGIQAAQINAAARWAGRGGDSVILESAGPRVSVAALCASALEPDATAELILEEALGSLHTLIDERVPYDRAPELFCFGLLESFDLDDLARLSQPKPLERRIAREPFPAKK
ncbi:MAG: hypothetical protein SFX72_05685 [Isosphaeraceae bacterium]|nr:hypothetical protein [Isosphaeraceae bacterium]